MFQFLATTQVRYQLDNQTTATIMSNVATVLFPIASVRRLTRQGNKVVFKEKHSDSENRTGTGWSWCCQATPSG